MFPSIDHSLLSPNGRMSKRARKAAMDREAKRLFEGVTSLTGEYTQEQINEQKRQHNLNYAAFLRDLAAKGMNPKKHLKLAIQLEAEAEQLKT